MKKRIKITEGQIRRVVNHAINLVMREGKGRTRRGRMLRENKDNLVPIELVFFYVDRRGTCNFIKAKTLTNIEEIDLDYEEIYDYIERKFNCILEKELCCGRVIVNYNPPTNIKEVNVKSLMLGDGEGGRKVTLCYNDFDNDTAYIIHLLTDADEDTLEEYFCKLTGMSRGTFDINQYFCCDESEFRFKSYDVDLTDDPILDDEDDDWTF